MCNQVISELIKIEGNVIFGWIKSGVSFSTCKTFNHKCRGENISVAVARILFSTRNSIVDLKPRGRARKL